MAAALHTVLQHSVVHDDRPRRTPKERTGKHYCIECLKEVPAEDYFRNDHVCDDCGRKKEERTEEPRKDE
jgi:rRNA maturation endonuclease Nob1